MNYSKKKLIKVKQKFERTASTNYEKTTKTHESSSEDSRINIMILQIQDSSVSVKQIGEENGISKSVVNRS